MPHRWIVFFSVGISPDDFPVSPVPNATTMGFRHQYRFDAVNGCETDLTVMLYPPRDGNYTCPYHDVDCIWFCRPSCQLFRIGLDKIINFRGQINP